MIEISSRELLDCYLGVICGGDLEKAVILHPWRCLRDVMDGDGYEEVRFYHFGVFRPQRRFRYIRDDED